VKEAIVEAVLDENRDSEFERAREVWQKKFGVPPADAADKARQLRFLQSRGFTSEVIRRVVAEGAGHRPGFNE